MWLKIGLCRHLKLFKHKTYYVYRASKKIELNVTSCKGWEKIVLRSLDVYIASENIFKNQKMCLSSLCKIGKNRSHWNTLKKCQKL